MVSSDLIYDVKLSSVVPSKIRGGEEGENYELSGKDLAMKLHYMTTLHFFERDAMEGLDTHDLKKPMFEWLDVYYPICGRIRSRHVEEEGDFRGRYFVKCNDSGVRIVEAKCVKTLDDWLSNYVGDGESNELLLYNQQMVAHDLGFTPLVFLQLTEFKCGGLCLGMKWAHILGDAFTALNCINKYGDFMNNNQLRMTVPKTLTLKKSNPIHQTKTSHCKCLKILDPLRENWTIPNNRKMQRRTFRIKERSNLLSKSEEHTSFYKAVNKRPFESICGIIWRSLAKVRCSLEPKIVTVVRNKKAENELLGNSSTVIGTVEARDITSINIADKDALELSNLIAEKFVDETDMVEKLIMEDEHGGKGDFVIYGGNLTFVDLENADINGLSIGKYGPVHAEISIEGIGDEGVVLVMPLGHEYDDDGELRGRSIIIHVILPGDELQQLENVLEIEWDII